MTDADEIHWEEREKDIMRLELEWLLSSQMPTLVRQLKDVLQECLSKFELSHDGRAEQQHLHAKSGKAGDAPHAFHPMPPVVRPTHSRKPSSLDNTANSPNPASNPNPNVGAVISVSNNNFFTKTSNSIMSSLHHSSNVNLNAPNPPSPLAANPPINPQIEFFTPNSEHNGDASVGSNISTINTPSPSGTFLIPNLNTLNSVNASQASLTGDPTLHRTGSGNIPPKILGATFPLTTSGDILKGFVTLNGNSIVKADLTIKFSRWNNGKPFQTSLAPAAPYVLNQIQNSRNYVHLAVSELDNFTRDCDQDYTRENSRRLLNSISVNLKRAMDAVVYTNPNQKYSEVMFVSRSSFYPTLPSDLSIGFSISSDKLFVSVHGLHLLTSSQLSAKNARDRANTTTSYSIIGKPITVEGQNYEILDHVEVECSVPSLTEALAVMSAAHEKAHRMLTKLDVFA